ncbi:Myb/SANT-like domain-containing protein [Tanacetum coccineum]
MNTRDTESPLEDINNSFQMFVQGFNANFGTMANALANAIKNDNNRKKAKSEQLKDVLDELTKLNIPSGDVLHAAETFAANKENFELALNKFYENVLQDFMEHIDFKVVRCSVIASPGFTKLSFQLWTSELQDALNAWKHGCTAFRGKDLSAAIDSYTGVRL